MQVLERNRNWGKEKGKLWLDKTWSQRKLVCALPSSSAGESLAPPVQRRWKKVELIDGKNIKQILPKRGEVRAVKKNGVGSIESDAIEISSNSSSLPSLSDESHSCSTYSLSSDEPALVLQLPYLINVVDVSSWNPLLRIFMEVIGGVPGGN